MVRAAAEHKCVVQVGSQARSAEPAHQVCTYLRNGMLGKVSKVTCWHSTNPSGGQTREAPPPPEEEIGWLISPFLDGFCYGYLATEDGVLGLLGPTENAKLATWTRIGEIVQRQRRGRGDSQLRLR